MIKSERRPGLAAIGLAAAVLFAASLILPVATAQQTQGLTTIMGYELLFIGPFGMLNAQFGWLATPCLIFAISAALSKPARPGKLVTIIVLIVMLLALADAIAWRDYPNDGGPGPLVSHGLGFFAWIAAVLFGAVSLIIGKRDA